MLLNNCKKIFFSIAFATCFTALFAATTDLAVRFLDKANEAFEENKIEEAYKYINNALTVVNDEESQANVLYFAQTVYTVKLQNLLEEYDEMAFIEIQMNLEKYPNIENNKIKRIIKQIEAEQANKAKAAEEAEKEEQRKIDQERFETQQESMNQTTKAMQDLANITKSSSEETKNAIKSGLKDMSEAFDENAKEQKRSTKVIAFSVIGIAVIILIIVLLICVIFKHGIKQQKIQQEQYVQAFKMLAANQSQTNRLMLGGATDIYGQSNLKLAGSSTWASANALPDLTFTEEDEKELKQLAVKCEEIGQKIDSATGRKNNSKNVSEIVYKLSIQLGLPQDLAMLNFCAAMIYDAGFLGIDPDLLSAAALSEEEKEAMKEHVNLAEDYLSFVPKKYWTVFEDAAMKHHENVDGSGYPNRLKGEEIPQIARLIHVAESFVSLSSRRSYRGAIDKESAIAALREKENIYDKDVVDVLEQIV